MYMDYLVSIIIPVYKAEAYIERCAHALFRQTFLSIEYVFVDDFSQDAGMNIIQRIALDYPYRISAIRYIVHSKNRGVAAARNTGLFEAKGDYIIFFDSDDWMEPDTIEYMYTKAVRANADVVWTDFYKTYSDHETLSIQKIEPTSLACIKSLLCEKMHGGLWNKLVKRSLYDEYDIFFLPGLNIWEDLRVCVQLFSYAKTIAYAPSSFYHYVQCNKNSVCSGQLLARVKDTLGNAESIVFFLVKNGISAKVGKQINYLKLAAKRNLLTTVHLYSFMRWKLIYPEANTYIMSYGALPMHLRLLGWCAANEWWLLVKCWIFIKKIKR